MGDIVSIFVGVPLVFQSAYGFTFSQVGLIYVAVLVAAFISQFLSILQRRYYFKKEEQAGRPPRPEVHLYFSCVHLFFLPAGILIWGLSSREYIPWIVPVISVGFISMGIYSIYCTCFIYLADVYCLYASSALAGMSLVRNVVAGFVPLFGAQMFENLGFGTAGGILSGISLVLCAVPLILVAYGERIRGRSKFAQRLSAEERTAAQCPGPQCSQGP